MVSKDKSNSEEFNINLGGIKKLFSTLPNKKVWLSVLLIAIAIFFSVYFRSYSYDLPITDDWAYNNIYNSIRNQVTTQVNQQYPNLPAANKNQLIEEQTINYLNQQSAQLADQQKLISNSLKQQFQDETGQTYLLAIDPYFYYTETENILDHGHVGDELVDGKPFTYKRYAPNGAFVTPSLHPYIQAYYHKFMSIFTNNSLMKNIFFVPILLSALAVIPAFFIARKNSGYLGGFIAAMLVAVHAAFIGRTAGGFADTDAYNVLFPLFISWMFIEAFESKNIKKKIGFMAIGGFLTGLYSFAWSGWWYIFDFLLMAMVVYLLYLIVKSIVQNKGFSKLWSDSIRRTLIGFVSFVIFSGIFVSLFKGFNAFLKFFTGPLNFTVIKQAAKANLWPNVYTTVAELNPASIPSIIQQLGGKFFFFIAAMGVLLALMNKDKLKQNDYIILALGALTYLLLISSRLMALSPIIYAVIFVLPLAIGGIILLRDKREVDMKYALFLTFWFIGTIYAATKGTRFVLLMVPAFAVAFGIAIGKIHSILSNLSAKEFEVKRVYVAGILTVLLLLLLWSPISTAHNTAKGEIPSMNDGWWDTLTKIKTNTSEDAIITSWWDFGHWFKAIANRPVTFDGGSQNKPQAHWVGKALLSSNEDESAGILRMLDCGGNYAYDEINKKYDDTLTSVNLVNEIIMMSKNDAKELLEEKGFTSEEADLILQYSHCNPPQAIFITSGDMVSKSGVWAHFGSWDFERSFVYNNVRRARQQEAITLLTERLDITEEQASNYYFEVQSLTTDRAANDWIAPWPSYATPSWRPCGQNEGVIQCNIGINIGQSSQGQNVVISAALINLSNINNTRFVLSFIDSTTGLVQGQQESVPKSLVIAGNESLEEINLGGEEMDLTILYDSVTNRALVMNPQLSQSMFTRLFYLEGRYSDNYELFSDITDVSGSRILVWTTNW